MKDEIKEIDITKDLYLCSPLLNTDCSKENCYINNGPCCHTVNKEHSQQHLLDYITNLQEENEELREDNFAYHQLMKMQNKREYRSKFLKDFQKEYGKNVLPDYDEIYKRYDDYKTRNEKAIEYIKEHSTNTYFSMLQADYDMNLDILLNILQGKSDE